jgi:hypothetical protein
VSDESAPPEPDSPGAAGGPDAAPSTDEPVRRYRAFSLVVVGMSIAVWWPAFTLGAWGTLFFDQQLLVWVAATAAFFVVLLRPRVMGRRWPTLLALLVPSVWLVLGFAQDTTNVWAFVVELLGIVVGLLGIPFTLWALVRIIWPEMGSDLRLRTRIGAIVLVAGIAVASFVLGVNQNRFLSCQDFDISGNSRPPGCVVATPEPTP